MQLGLQCYYTFYCSVEQCGMCRIIILKRRLSIIRSLWLFWHATFYSSWFSLLFQARTNAGLLSPLLLPNLSILQSFKDYNESHCYLKCARRRGVRLRDKHR